MDWKKDIAASEKGESLIEILASLVLLSIIIVPFMAFFTGSSQSASTSERIMDATYLAQMKMEQEIHSGSGTYEVCEPASNYYVYIERNDTDLPPGLERILVSVFTDENCRGRAEAQLETIVQIGSGGGEK
ncbi:type IV pilus modification PilV family protein [Alteribacter natronophilus]|uniref:type IV pilus modification PilV family protein n=1 Tax=Alteribacter natronophilus TaxID=2583810 RepID=UPI00110F0836|nr:type II secretion system protein [Alteribacter natronophilus]TMW72049.1 type II secretion system protein [Alteribacter natronophilus]